MRALAPLLPVVLLTCALAVVASAQDKPSTHADYFEHYAGTSTCLGCHDTAATSFFYSQHYQWRGNAPQIVNSYGKKLGKINTFNDFCTSPTGNWIGIVRNSRGDVITRGCSACHAGQGKPPSEVISREQLENIDCLVCHASGYRRDLYETEDGGVAWKPILWKNPAGLDSVARRISLPTRAMCLRCHAASGGGPNYKRGDLEYKLADPDRDFDVHMASDGANLQCIACHGGTDHRVRGRGTDLSATDMPNRPLSCATNDCHGSTPHKETVLDGHARRVNCTVCHIPSFAREEPTDMSRDWSKAVYNAEADKYTAEITFGKDVRPVYAWYNGTTRAQLLGEPAYRLPDGSVGMMVPQGSRRDPTAKIFAFKLHRARLPILLEKNWLVPIAVESFFPTGKVDPAVRAAAEEIYGIRDAKYSWTSTTRYMGIFHGVQPAKRALTCLDCHGASSRLDWKALGYPSDPVRSAFSARR